MNREIKKLAFEFNSVAPPPPPPVDDTVYENETSLLKVAGAAVQAPNRKNGILPTWFNAMRSPPEWFRALKQTELGRKIQDGFDSYGQIQTPLPRDVTGRLIRGQIKALYEAERQAEPFGYKIIDPLHPLEDLESPATKAWIDSENERTAKFTAGSAAREKCETFLKQAWQDRVIEPFSTSVDRHACHGYLHRQDPWIHPFNGKLEDRSYHVNEKVIDETGVRVIASRPVGSKTNDQKIVTFLQDCPDEQKTIVAGAPGNRLRGGFVHRGRLFVSLNHNCTDELKVFTPEGAHLADVPLPVCKLKATSIDEATGNLRLTLETFTRPECDYIYDIESNSLTLAEGKLPAAPLDDCIVEQVWAPSRDGTKVPIWVVRSPDTDLDGTAALKIFSYGAAGIPVKPRYSAGVAQWIRAGGIFALASLRGGDELGPGWTEQGQRMKRQNVIDDLVGCARELCRRGYTVPERTVIEGGSNGGWLILETVVQNRFPFGAAISHVPVSDLNRIGAGSGDYPAKWDSKEFPERMRLSPCHNVKPGEIYTPTIITTGDADTIASTWHALKMAAALQATSPENLCLLRVRHGTGHRAEFIPNDELAAEEADIHAFVEKCIGPIDQNEYKASPYCAQPPQPASKDPAYVVG